MEFKLLVNKNKKPDLKKLNHIFIINNKKIFLLNKTEKLGLDLFYDIYFTTNFKVVEEYSKKYPSSLFILLKDSENFSTQIELLDNLFILSHPFKENLSTNFNNILVLLKKIRENNIKSTIFELSKIKRLSEINTVLYKAGFRLYVIKNFNKESKLITLLADKKNQIVTKKNNILGFSFHKNNKIYFFKSLWSKNSTIDKQLIEELFDEIKKRFFSPVKNIKKQRKKIISIKEKEIFLGDHIGEGLFILNKKGAIIFHNKMFEKMFKDNSQLFSKIKTFLNQNKITSLFKRWQINNEPFSTDIEIPDNKEHKTFNITLSPVLDNDRITHICAIIRDITIQKKLEHELKISNLKASLMNNKLISVQNAIIHGFSKLSEYKDKETSNHLERIQNYVKIIAYELYKREIFVDFKNDKENYLSEDYVEEISISSLLHDIGKVGVPDNILLKPERLTKNEFEHMKLHTKIGGDTLKSMDNIVGEISILALAKDIAYYHHERWNGTGYPFGLKKNQIPLSARIVALCDVYDALTSERPYKNAYDHEKASEIIYDSSGIQFDPLIVSVFSSIEKQFKAIRNKFKD